MHSSQLSDPIDLTGRRIFITGGTGFVGRTLLDYLDESHKHHHNDLEVVVMSRTPEAFLREYPAYAHAPWLRVVAGDVEGNFPKEDSSFTDIIHAAGDTHVMGNSVAWINQIVGGTQAALEFACKVGAKRFLLTSSGAVYGTWTADASKLSEFTFNAPPTNSILSTYGQAKRLAEQLCTSFWYERGLETVVARCFAFVGPHIPVNGPYAIGNFIRDALYRDHLLVRGDGTAIRSYLYGRDMAHWLIAMLTRAEAGSCFNVGSDQTISIRELAQMVVNQLSPDKTIVIEQAIKNRDERSIYVPDISQAQTLGLTVECELSDAIQKTARYLASNNAYKPANSQSGPFSV